MRTTTGWPVPDDPAQVAAARVRIREVLREWGHAAGADVVLLLADELLANALTHGRPPVHLRLEADTAAGTLRCEVSDADPRPPRHRSPGAWDEHGYGLLLVQALSVARGWHRTAGGKVVWFRTALDPGG
ncbi:ATP-binding protein [Actinomadura physcomitrii]|uniref:ATP-binding protein n=1 Tax=Actinomadura physcomitrii TaxID=2650748 RepID=UPI00136AEA88|nr:ATP-binding protein [Actinomadura physcomitrii]